MGIKLVYFMLDYNNAIYILSLLIKSMYKQRPPANVEQIVNKQVSPLVSYVLTPEIHVISYVEIQQPYANGIRHWDTTASTI